MCWTCELRMYKLKRKMEIAQHTFCGRLWRRGKWNSHCVCSVLTCVVFWTCKKRQQNWISFNAIQYRRIWFWKCKIPKTQPPISTFWGVWVLSPKTLPSRLFPKIEFLRTSRPHI
jgi:hypothetical protein